MKKSKGLILSSIIMIVLVTLALSTATFAWFSSGNVVNIATIAFFASSGTDAESNDLVLAWDKNSVPDVGQDLAFLQMGDMDPMVPLNKPTVGTSLYESFVGNNFFTALETVGVEEIRFTSEPFAANPVVCTSSDGAYEKFFAVNKNEAFGLYVTVEYEISGENSSALRVAMFVDGKLCGIMCNAEEVTYGEIVNGELTSSLPTDKDSVSPSGELHFRLGANVGTDSNMAEIRLVAWYDGNSLNNAGQNLSARFEKLKFTGAYVEA